MSVHEDVVALLARARGPLGTAPGPTFDRDSGPLAELAELLGRCNGFALFDYGVQVFRAGDGGAGPELGAWNEPETWRDSYGGLADGLCCFAQDLFGVQFAVDGRDRVVSIDPETAERTELGASLADWAGWLLADPDVRGAAGFARAWQDEHGPLGHDERLLPSRLFVLGGEYTAANLAATDAVTAMRVRGPIAQQVHGRRDGTTVRVLLDDR